MSVGQVLLAWLIIVVCLILMLVVLLQRGRGGGLAGAFGGGGGGGAFGAKTGDVFTWITVAFGSLFVLLAIVANFAFEPSVDASPTPAEASAAFPTDGEGGTDADGIPVTIPVGEGEEVGAIELIGKDGEVIQTIDPSTLKPATEGNAPAQPPQTPPAESDGGSAAPQGDGGSTTGDTTNSDDGGPKDPGS